MGVLTSIPILLFLYLMYLLARPPRRPDSDPGAGRQPRRRVSGASNNWPTPSGIVPLDFGFFYPTDTPLMFLDRFIEDEEHNELAWLVTRSLWGDLRDDDDDAALSSVAEELSRALRRRLASAQPGTVRLVAAVALAIAARPYARDRPLHRTPRKERAHEAVPAG